MNEGWKCPECGRCYAPWVKSCDAVDCGTVQQPGRVTINPPGTLGEPNPWESRTNDPIPGIAYWPKTWDGSDDTHAACTCPLCCPGKWDLNANGFSAQWSYTI